MRKLALTALLALAPLFAQAQAAPAPQDPTIHRHLGFFLRLDAGMGYAGSSASSGGATLSLKGFAIPFGVAVGGAVSENFILAGDLWATSALSPSVTWAGLSGTASGASMTMGGIGLNLTYYFMPHNVYVSLTPSIVTLSLNNGVSSASTNAGFGLKAGVGKEWWVGNHWGIGLAAQFVLGINKDQGSSNPPTFTTLGGALAFSATYN